MPEWTPIGTITHCLAAFLYQEFISPWGSLLFARVQFHWILVYGHNVFADRLWLESRNCGLFFKR